LLAAAGLSLGLAAAHIVCPICAGRCARPAGTDFRLGSACRMSTAAQQVSRSGDVLLPVCLRLRIGFMFAGGGCLGLFGRPGRGACYQAVVGWRGAGRGACQKFSQVVGVRDACS